MIQHSLRPQISIFNRMRPSRIKDKFSLVFFKVFTKLPESRSDEGNLWKLWKYKWKFILNSTRAQCDCLFITQRAKFLKTFDCTSKHNPPAALKINNSPHKQFIKQLLSVQNQKRNCLLCICSSFEIITILVRWQTHTLKLKLSKFI